MFGESDEDDPPNTPTKKPKKHRTQKFRLECLKIDEFRNRLVSVNHDPLKAKCKLCNFVMVAELTNIQSHGKGKKHKEIVACKEIKQNLILYH